MLLHTVILNALATSLLFVKPSTAYKTLTDQDNRNATECSCFLKTVYVPWSVIKTQIENLKKKDEAFDGKLLSRLKVQNGAIPVKWCLREPTSSQEAVSECATGPMVMRSQVVPVSERHSSRLVSFDYMEPKSCLCSEDHEPVASIFPVIVHAKIADLCHPSTEVRDSVIVDVGSDALMKFIYHTSNTTDVPQNFMIHKDDGFSYPLLHQLLRRINNGSPYISPYDWRSRTKIYPGNGRVRLQIQNTDKADEGTYFCLVEFLNSSACFSSVRLNVLSDAEDTPHQYCEPQLTFADWPTVRQEMKAVPTGHRLIIKTNTATNFWVKKCTLGPNSLTSNEGPRGHCVANSTLTRQITKCVPNGKINREAKILIDYEEDDTCFLDTEGTRKRDTGNEIKTINIARMERNGTCTDTCKPENVTISWEDLRLYLNKWTYVRIRDDEKSENLTFQKCRQELSPCALPDTFCDVEREKRSRKNMKLQTSGLTLTMKYYEATKCRCRKRSEMSYEEGVNLYGPPVVTYVAKKDI